jgi:sugar phosphate isomerase/epimerase
MAERLAAWVGRSQQVYPGVVVVLENHWGVSTDIGRHLAVYEGTKERLGVELRPYFGLCFDPGNMKEGEEERYWPALAQGARHVHIKCGRVLVDYAKVFVLLDEAGYRGTFTLEFEGDGAVAAGVKEGVAVFEQVRGQGVVARRAG